MRKVAIVAVAIGLMGMAYADLQNVQVGGMIEMRGRWIHNTYNENGATVVRNGYPSIFSWDDGENAFFEETTSLNVSADFTEHVSAFVEFYSYNKWGEGFRTNYLSGIDSLPGTNPNLNVVVLQSYIETNETFGAPLRLRIGRQCMTFGKKFMISDKTTPTQRLSFDALRATYTPTEKLTIDAWASKLADNSPAEEDGDVDFYGVYGTYAESDAINASLYYMMVRDGRDNANLLTALNRATSTVSAANADASLLNVVGGRFWGKYEAFDYAAELAYEFGEADGEAVVFGALNGLAGVQPGDEQWDNLGMDAEVGYTFDCKWQPRLFLGGVLYEGGNVKDVGGNKYVMTPSFNRLFSDTNYCPALQDNGDMSNFNQIRLGVIAKPAEKVSVMLRGQQLWVNQAWKDSADDLGFHLDTVIKYQYSPDLLVTVYYGHLFAGEALQDGNFIHSYGNTFDAGSDDGDVDYAFWMLSLKF